MTLDFAKQEAQRRTVELGTVHHVVKSKTEVDEYLVMTHIPWRYEVVFTYHPIQN